MSMSFPWKRFPVHLAMRKVK